MKTFADYEASAARTDKEHPLEYYALGVAGEAGEVADAVKKGVYHGGVLDRAKIIKEMGDTLWYLARLSAKLGTTLTDVAQVNAIKLAARYPNGYSDEASAARADLNPEAGHGAGDEFGGSDFDEEPTTPGGPLGATLRRMRNA